MTEWTGITAMKFNRGGYLIGEGFRNIGKHGFMSFASVTIIMACLIIMGSVSLLSVNIDALIKDLEDQNEVAAFVDENLSDEEAMALEEKITAVDNVESAEFVSREAAMDNFFDNYDSYVMEGIDKTVFRHRYVIHLTDIALMADTTEALKQVDGIAKVRAHIEYADIFVTIRNVVSIVSLVLIIMLVFVSVFIMSNTIKLATFNRREEIAIMKMVGANNGFIRLPFVVEGLILGLMGGCLAFLAEWGVYELLTGKIISTVAGSFIKVVPFTEVAVPVLICYLGTGILVGVFGGVNAIRNYLKV